MAVIKSNESFYTANPSISNTTSSASELSPLIELNGKLYLLTVHYQKSNESEWKEVTASCLKLAKGRDLQEVFQQAIAQADMSSGSVEIQAAIHPNTKAVFCNVQNGNKKRTISLPASQQDKILEIFHQIRPLRNGNPVNLDSFLSKENLDKLNSSFVKMSLEEVKAKRVADYLAQVRDYKPHNLVPYERAIGLGNKGNNCCINVTLQMILNHPALRTIWEACFGKTAYLYYEALRAGKSSAPSTVGTTFRNELVTRYPSNLIDKNLHTQEDPTALLEVFFNVACKEKRDLSSLKIKFETMRYRQVAGEKAIPSIKEPEKHEKFRISIINQSDHNVENNQSDHNVELEALLFNDCLGTSEVNENDVNVTYSNKDQYVSLPDCLIIDLFTDKKRASNVLIPMNLKIPQDLLKDKHSIHEYELEGFVVHLGSTHNSGHYIAFRKVHGQWKQFNDSVVTDIDTKQLEKELLQKGNPTGFFQRLIGTQAILGPLSEKPYPCMLSYSKKPSVYSTVTDLARLRG